MFFRFRRLTNARKSSPRAMQDTSSFLMRFRVTVGAQEVISLRSDSIGFWAISTSGSDRAVSMFRSYGNQRNSSGAQAELAGTQAEIELGQIGFAIYAVSNFISISVMTFRSSP